MANSKEDQKPAHEGIFVTDQGGLRQETLRNQSLLHLEGLDEAEKELTKREITAGRYIYEILDRQDKRQVAVLFTALPSWIKGSFFKYGKYREEELVNISIDKFSATPGVDILKLTFQDRHETEGVEFFFHGPDWIAGQRRLGIQVWDSISRGKRILDWERKMVLRRFLGFLANLAELLEPQKKS